VTQQPPNLQQLRQTIIDGLRFRYGDCPSDAVFTVDWVDADDKYHSTLYKCHESDFAIIADRWAGDTESHVFSRIAVLGPGWHGPGRGTERDTYGTTTLQVDIDPPKDLTPEDWQEWRNRKLVELRSFTPRPTRIEFSGRGLYGLWKCQWIANWETIKQIQKALSYAVGGDNTYDTARVLRLPGTFNGKAGAQQVASVVEEDPSLVYEVHHFPKADLDRHDERLLEAQVEAAVVTQELAAQLAAHPQLWRRIETELGAHEAGAVESPGNRGHVDRSRNDYNIALQMLRLGFAVEEVAGVLTHATWFSGEKFRSPPNSYNPRYVWQTLASALLYVDKVSTDIVKISDMIVDGAERNFLFWQEDLWAYDEERGVYVPGETEFQLAVQGYAGEKWRSHVASEVRANVRVRLRPSTGPDSIPGRINTRSGVLYWEAVTVQAHTPSVFSVMQVDARWDPASDTAAVDAFVERILKPEDVPIWWQFCGYCLDVTVPIPFHKMLALIGPSRTGKSTLVNALGMFLGPSNVSTVPLDELVGGGNQFTAAMLRHALLNISAEANTTKRTVNVSLLKALTGGDAVKLERKGIQETPHQLLPVKLAFVMNAPPQLGTSDSAFYGRWLVLAVREDARPFTDDNPRRIANMHAQLLSSPANRSAWLKRSVEGLQSLYASNGFPVTKTQKEAATEFRGANDLIYRWWSEETVDGGVNWIPLSTCFHSFDSWQKSEVGPWSATSMRSFVFATNELAFAKELPGLITRRNESDDRWEMFGRKRRG
jgi:Family of unknown function (DUF5906)